MLAQLKIKVSDKSDDNIFSHDTIFKIIIDISHIHCMCDFMSCSVRHAGEIYSGKERMKDNCTIRELEVKFPKAIQTQIKMLDKLGSMLQKQKELIENGEFEQLFSTRCEKDQIVKEIKIQGDGIVQLQQEWHNQKKHIPKYVNENLNELVTELSHMIQGILTRENQNYTLLERTQSCLKFMESETE